MLEPYSAFPITHVVWNYFSLSAHYVHLNNLSPRPWVVGKHSGLSLDSSQQYERCDWLRSWLKSKLRLKHFRELRPFTPLWVPSVWACCSVPQTHHTLSNHPVCLSPPRASHHFPYMYFDLHPTPTPKLLRHHPHPIPNFSWAAHELGSSLRSPDRCLATCAKNNVWFHFSVAHFSICPSLPSSPSLIPTVYQFDLYFIPVWALLLYTSLSPTAYQFGLYCIPVWYLSIPVWSYIPLCLTSFDSALSLSPSAVRCDRGVPIFDVTQRFINRLLLRPGNTSSTFSNHALRIYMYTLYT